MPLQMLEVSTAEGLGWGWGATSCMFVSVSTHACSLGCVLYSHPVLPVVLLMAEYIQISEHKILYDYYYAD